MKDILALTDLEDSERRELLAMDDAEYAAVASFCNRYPDITLEFTVLNGRERTEAADADEKKSFVCDTDTEEVRQFRPYLVA